MPPRGVCSTQFLITLSSASAVQFKSHFTRSPSGTSMRSVCSRSSAEMESGSHAFSSTARASCIAGRNTIAPASSRASFSREDTSHSSRSSCACNPLENSSRRSGGRSGDCKRSASIIIEVNGVFSWCEMSDIELARRVFSSVKRWFCSRRMRVTLWISFCRILSSPSSLFRTSSE